jgi:tetratricopeptide (TPR) repeat protein
MFASEADAALVDRATQATRELPSIDACADLVTLTAAVAPPTERRVGEQVTALRATLSKIEAMQYAGRYKQAAAAATKAVAEADAVPYEPLQAEALYLEGRLLRFAGEKDTAEAAVRKALTKAGHARDHVLVAKSASELLVAVGMIGGRVEEAASLIDLATESARDRREVRADGARELARGSRRRAAHRTRRRRSDSSRRAAAARGSTRRPEPR